MIDYGLIDVEVEMKCINLSYRVLIYEGPIWINVLRVCVCRVAVDRYRYYIH